MTRGDDEEDWLGIRFGLGFLIILMALVAVAVVLLVVLMELVSRAGPPS